MQFSAFIHLYYSFLDLMSVYVFAGFSFKPAICAVVISYLNNLNLNLNLNLNIYGVTVHTAEVWQAVSYIIYGLPHFRPPASLQIKMAGGSEAYTPVHCLRGMVSFINS